MTNFAKARFITSAPSAKEGPRDHPALLFIGRSNVGKSTLINALTRQKIAFSSKKAGKTKALNYFLIDDRFYIIDAPGYGSTGFATMETIGFASFMEGILKMETLHGIVLLLDLRREMGKDDVAFLEYLRKSGVPLVYVLTKCDQMNQSALHKARKMAEELQLDNPIYSHKDGRGIEQLRGAIGKLV